MGDWEINIPENPPDRNPVVDELESQLETSSERLLLAQKAMRVAERDLSSLVKEAVAAGIPVPKVAALSRVATDDIRRVLEKGGLY